MPFPVRPDPRVAALLAETAHTAASALAGLAVIAFVFVACLAMGAGA